MGDTTKITWTDHTQNNWLVCTNVSPGCDRCYAQTLVTTRMKHPWGAGAPRVLTSLRNRHAPFRWNRAAQKEGVRKKVFTASLADVFDAEVPRAWLDEVWATIRATPWLDWQLLTKRHARIAECLPADWGDGYENVWLGVSAENQTWADIRIPYLLNVPARVHWVSAEPLLGPLDLSRYLRPEFARVGDSIESTRVDWVVVGGESGKDARPMSTLWARSLRAQCRFADVPYFFKQLGTAESGDGDPTAHHGGDLLDGTTYHEFPEVR